MYVKLQNYLLYFKNKNDVALKFGPMTNLILSPLDQMPTCTYYALLSIYECEQIIGKLGKETSTEKV